jgi:dipeptidyl aminopeptidase/acylaminoacyl peptidase
MKLRFAFLMILCAPLLWGASGPDDRRPTDSQSIVSPSNPLARPVPIDDLYFTRGAYVPAWSPDGRQVVFTTDMSGRYNLWKVNSAGGWPVQLTQSDDVQFRAAWSPDGKLCQLAHNFPQPLGRRWNQDHFCSFCVVRKAVQCILFSETLYEKISRVQ